MQKSFLSVMAFNHATSRRLYNHITLFSNVLRRCYIDLLTANVTNVKGNTYDRL